MHCRTLYRLRDAGALDEVSRGLFALPGTVWHPELVTAALRAPSGVVCLISALSYYQIGSEIARELYLAVPPGTKTPTLVPHAVRVFRWSGAAYEEGIETREVDGVAVRIYSPSKTVADCFRARNKLGIGVAVDALRDALDQDICTPAEIQHYAQLIGVKRVMRPYFEALQ